MSIARSCSSSSRLICAHSASWPAERSGVRARTAMLKILPSQDDASRERKRIACRRCDGEPHRERQPAATAQGALLATGLALLVAALGGCGGVSRSTDASVQSERTALVSYLRQVEPIRLAVNRLLEGADPILSAYHDRRISPTQASRQMGVLERRFATYTVDIAALRAGHVEAPLPERPLRAHLHPRGRVSERAHRRPGRAQTGRPARYTGRPASGDHPVAHRPGSACSSHRRAPARRPAGGRPGRDRSLPEGQLIAVAAATATGIRRWSRLRRRGGRGGQVELVGLTVTAVHVPTSLMPCPPASPGFWSCAKV